MFKAKLTNEIYDSSSKVKGYDSIPLLELLQLILKEYIVHSLFAKSQTFP